jgi:predicted nucleotidyltransferase
MNKDVLEIVTSLKNRYLDDGFEIVGIGGSYARGDETPNSDLDLVYKISNPSLFVAKYGGFGAFGRIAELKKEIAESVGKQVDLIALNSLNQVGRKYILKDIFYVV